MAHFEKFKPRQIQFYGVVKASNWQVKVYKQTKNERFSAQATFEAVLTHLPAWMEIPSQTSLAVYEQAFLIVHEAREGTWILLYWWTGGEMLNRSTWFATFDEPEQLIHQPENDRLVCVWELEIVMHERHAWIRHVLDKPMMPDFAGYNVDVITAQLQAEGGYC